MSVQKIEAAVRQLPSQELSQFADWFTRFHADAWDAQIESDAAAGKLDALAAETSAEYHADYDALIREFLPGQCPHHFSLLAASDAPGASAARHRIFIGTSTKPE